MVEWSEDGAGAEPHRRFADRLREAGEGLSRLAPVLRFGLAGGFVCIVAAALIGLRQDIETPHPDAAVAPPSFVKLVERTPPARRAPTRPVATPADFAAVLAEGGGRQTLPALDYVQPLASSAAVRPKQLCKALKAAGFDNDGWRESEVYPGSFECASVVLAPDAPPAPHFFVLRGPAERELSAAMLKTNAATDEPVDARAETQRFLQVLSDAGVLLPPDMMEAVAGTGTVEGRSALGAVKARPEYQAPERRIVSLTFARRLDVPGLKATCADACGAAFAALRRTVPPVSVKSRTF